MPLATSIVAAVSTPQAPPVVFEQVISHPYADSEVALFLGNARFKTGEFTADGKIHPLAITALTPDREPIGMERAPGRSAN
jgi:hypothetical protein